MAETPVVTVGEKVSATTKTWPTTAVMSYKSSDETVATVDGKGQITGVKAGEATITATLECGSKTVEKSTTVTVKDAVAVLSAVTQTASNAFTATFTADASKTITKDDIKIAAADGSVELAVKSVEYSADGLSAKVTVYNNFTDAAAYKVTCKDAVVEFTAKVGAVARVAISTASAQQNVETPIAFTLFDAEGIDVTPNVNLDTTCFVTVTGDYSAATLDKASRASITMNKVGDTVDVTVTYNSNAVGAQDVAGTQKITCVDAKAVQGAKLFVSRNAIPAGLYPANDESGCAKFYLGLSDTSVTVKEGTSDDEVYFCAKDDSGDVISYDSYEIESSNEDVAGVSVIVSSGKYAKLSVTGNMVGSVTLNVTAIKNGKSTYYTIPVSIVTVYEAVRMTAEVTRPIMSDVIDNEYYGEVKAKLFDRNGEELTDDRVSVNWEVTTKDHTNFNFVGDTNRYTAAGAAPKTYTIKVTGADNKTGKTFEKNLSVVVKKLDVSKPLSLSYQIETSTNTVDENPADTRDDAIVVRLYATANGLFAGYVKVDDTTGDVVVGDGTHNDNPALNTQVIPAKKINAANAYVQFGTKMFGAEAATANGKIVANGRLYGTGAAGKPSITSGAAMVFSAVGTEMVSGQSVTKYDPEGKSNSLAKTGAYTIKYELYEGVDENDTSNMTKITTTKSKTFTVTNSLPIPTVSAVTRTADSLSVGDIIRCLKTNVDMNNNTSVYESILTLATSATGEGHWNTVKVNDSNYNQTATAKYAVIKDNYDNGTWYFYVPLNATFKAE